MFRILLFFFFRILNTPYEKFNKNSLNKLISEDNLIKELLSKKEFYYKWRQKFNTKIVNEKNSIKKVTIQKKKDGIIIQAKTIHSFKFHMSGKDITSSETLDYIFYFVNFKIVDMCVKEYDCEKYRKLLYCGLNLHKPFKSCFSWNSLLSSIDDIFDKYTKLTETPAQGSTYRSQKLYNRDKAVSYAQKYALKYNSYYSDFSNNGGDCTNYISQCIHAGNLHLSSKWKPYTTTWIRVNELYYYLIRNDFAYDTFSISDLNKGDIIQFFSNTKGYFIHSGIVTDVLESGELLYCCHTYDKLNYPLSQVYPILYNKIRLLKISF